MCILCLDATAACAAPAGLVGIAWSSLSLDNFTCEGKNQLLWLTRIFGNDNYDELSTRFLYLAKQRQVGTITFSLTHYAWLYAHNVEIRSLFL